ncbi:MAG: hypothetical protein QF662_09345, partial [Phycisphaerae bacterium]|nr:hypothetical protein [Phycisphaerae bacterium]
MKLSLSRTGLYIVALAACGMIFAICTGAAAKEDKKPAKAADRLDAPPPLKEAVIPPIPEVGEDLFAPGKPKPKPKKTPLKTEGRRLINRAGRLVRREGGELVFIFDSGDLPVRLSPNKLREQIENRTSYGSKPIRFRISGLI